MFAIVQIYFARCTTYSIKPFRVEILQIFQLLFWKIDDFINSFWINLTFSGHPDVHSWYNVYKLCSVKKDTRLNQVFYLIKSSGIIFIFYLDFTWLYGSWHHQRILKKYPFWKHDSSFSSEVSKLTSVFYPWNDAFSGMKK